MEELKKRINESNILGLENYFFSERNNDNFLRLLAELCIDKLSKPLGKIFVPEQTNIWSNIMEYLPLKYRFRIGISNSTGRVFLTEHLQHLNRLFFSHHYENASDLSAPTMNSVNFINNFNNSIGLYCPNLINYKTYITSRSSLDIIKELINILFNNNIQHLSIKNLSCNNFTSSTSKPFRYKANSWNGSEDEIENYVDQSVILHDFISDSIVNLPYINVISDNVISNIITDNAISDNNNIDDILENDKVDNDINIDEADNINIDEEGDNTSDYIDERDEIINIDGITNSSIIGKIEEFIVKNYSWTQEIKRLVQGKINYKLKKLTIDMDEVGLYLFYNIIDLIPNLESVNISLDSGYYRKVHIEKQGVREEIGVILLREIYKKIGHKIKRTHVLYFDCHFLDYDTPDFWDKVGKEDSLMILHHAKNLEYLKIWGKITKKNLEIVCRNLQSLKSLTIDFGPDIFDFASNLYKCTPNLINLTLIHRKDNIKTYITLDNIKYILAQHFLKYFSIKFSHTKYELGSINPTFTHSTHVLNLLQSCRVLFTDWNIDSRKYTSRSGSSGFIISFSRLE